MISDVTFLPAIRPEIGTERLSTVLPAAPLPVRDTSARSATVDDLRLGARVRELRKSIGMSQCGLAALIGVTNAQLHRYERGASRIPASRLINIAAAIGLEISTLTDASRPAAQVRPRQDHEVELLLHAFNAIEDPKQRSAVVTLARSMARLVTRDMGSGR